MEMLSIPSHWHWQRRMGMSLILVAALLLGVFQPLPTAHADTGFAYYWSLTFDFESGSTGHLYVAVGYNDNGMPQEPAIYAHTYDVPCQRVGNATVAGNVLALQGGYLTCEVDFQRTLQAAIAACDAEVPGCHVTIEDVERYDSFQAEATVWSDLPGEAPIFHHRDASYSIHPQSSMTQITADLAPHGIIPSLSLPAFPVLDSWQYYEALYSCGGVCQMQYATAGGVQVVNTANSEVPFYTPSSTLYIGHNPDTGVTAPAGTLIEYLFVDPPNHGNH